MRIAFAQGFVDEILVVYNRENNNDTKDFTIKQPTLEKVVNEVAEVIDEEAITEVVLMGNTRILKGLEKYYTNFKGVNIEWL